VRESLTTFHVNRIGNNALAISQMGAIATTEGAGNFDVLDRVVIFVAQRKVTRAFEPSPARRQDCDEIFKPAAGEASIGAACAGISGGSA